MKKLFTLGVIATGSIGASAMAQDAPEPYVPDFTGMVSTAVDTVNGVSPVILTVGTAIIGLAAVAMGIRWVKATFF